MSSAEDGRDGDIHWVTVLDVLVGVVLLALTFFGLGRAVRWWCRQGCRLPNWRPSALGASTSDDPQGIDTSWKHRFIYEFDPSHIRDLVRVDALADHDVDDVCLDDLPSEEHQADATFRRRGTPLRASGVEDACPPADLRLAYRDGASVEMYSQSHRRWLPGRVQVHSAAEADNCYHVKLMGKMRRTQLRKGISLSELRLPFQEGELVEVWSKRGGGTWVPGIVVGFNGAKSWATVHGYRVRSMTEDGTAVCGNVCAERLRRRYPDHTAVKLYRGPEIGWVLAVVDVSSTPVGEGDIDVPSWVGPPRFNRSSTTTSMMSEFSVFSAATSTVSQVSVAPPSSHAGRGRGDAGRGTKGNPEAMWQRLPVRALDEDVGQLVLDYLVQPDVAAETPLQARSPSIWRSKASVVAARVAQCIRSGQPTGHDEFHAMWPNGEVVEYFSRTHQCWMKGTFQAEVIPGTIFERTRAEYMVCLKSGATSAPVRKRAKLRLLRKPLARNELVEVFSRRSLGTWLPAVVLEGSEVPSKDGYSIQLVRDGSSHKKAKPLRGVPANRLRRRFPIGSGVKVYKGPTAGWVSAVVETPSMVQHSLRGAYALSSSSKTAGTSVGSLCPPAASGEPALGNPSGASGSLAAQPAAGASFEPAGKDRDGDGRDGSGAPLAQPKPRPKLRHSVSWAHEGDASEGSASASGRPVAPPAAATAAGGEGRAAACGGTALRPSALGAMSLPMSPSSQGFSAAPAAVAAVSGDFEQSSKMRRSSSATSTTSGLSVASVTSHASAKSATSEASAASDGSVDEYLEDGLSMCTLGSAAKSCAADIEGSSKTFSPWFMLMVREIGADHGLAVPSYLVRLTTQLDDELDP